MTDVSYSSLTNRGSAVAIFRIFKKKKNCEKNVLTCNIYDRKNLIFKHIAFNYES